MTSERWNGWKRHGGVTRERRRREWATGRRRGKKGRGGGRKKGGKRKRKQRVHLSPLDLPSVHGVYPLSRAAPREFNSIFNLPKPLYANSATDVEYFWTFSTLFCVPSARPLRPIPYSFFSGAASFHSGSSSERRHTFPPLLASFTNVASRIFGRRS